LSGLVITWAASFSDGAANRKTAQHRAREPAVKGVLLAQVKLPGACRPAWPSGRRGQRNSGRGSGGRAPRAE
jgi:hypothetical protein